MSTTATFRRHQSHTMRHRRRQCRHDNDHHQNQHYRPRTHPSPSLTTRPSSSSSQSPSSPSRKPTLPWIQFHQLLVVPVLSLLLLLLLAAVVGCHAQASSSLTWETSNDPDHLCANSDGSSKITGYKATLDCRGYVYCSDGYLMGGGIGSSGGGDSNAASASSDPTSTTSSSSSSSSSSSNNNNNNNSTTSGVISCWPNQLFDEINGVCTYWQNVDTSNCPEFDSAKMMPELTDENANEERFFCGVSASNAKSVCEPCPGGSRLECSDITHNCFAGITGCSATTGTSSSGAEEEDATTIPPPITTSNVVDNNDENFETMVPSSSSLPPTTLNNAVDNEGESFNSLNSVLPSLSPSPSSSSPSLNMNEMPSTLSTIAASVAETATTAAAMATLSTTEPPTLLPVSFPTTLRPTYPPVKEDDPTKRYCGYSWDDVMANCLTAIPCPGGYATGVCPLGMNCIAETPCTDQTYLTWLANNQLDSDTEQETIAQSGQTECSSNEDCELGLFCYQLIEGQGGTCGECQSNGMGCAVEEFCRISGCQTEQDSMGVSKCYTSDELNYDCGMKLDDASAKCNTELMVCESQSQQSAQQDDFDSDSQSTTTIINSSSQSTNTSVISTTVESTQTGSTVIGAPADTVAMTTYQNPLGNTYFCGVTYDEVLGQCLASKPCPSSIATDYCAAHEGCFSAPSCTEEYEAVTVESSLSPTSLNPSMQSTHAPSPESTSSTTLQPSADNNELVTQSTPPTTASSNSPTSLQPSGENNELVTMSTLPSLTLKPSTGSDELVAQPSSPTLQPSVASDELLTLSTQPATTSSPNLSSTSSPSDLAASLSPSKTPSVNTNFCGMTWEDHAQNCENSTPCPRGDECAPDESCFSSSPCATLNDEASAEGDSNVGNFCGTDWSTMIATCNIATKCDNGDECDTAAGEFCYRDFVCDPPLTLTTSTSSAMSDSNSTGNMASDDANGNPLASGQEIPSEFCNLCDSDGQITRSEPVTYDGNDISCGEFSWIFLSENIAAGSEKCLDIRAQHGGTCCNTKTTSSSGDGCDICNAEVDKPWNEVQSKKSVQFEGQAMSCIELSDKLRARFELASDQCLDSAKQYFDDCCFEKCSLCGDSDLLWEATVFYSGVELSCHDLDSKIFVEKGIASDTPTCKTSQDSYSGFCCLQPLVEPCDICSMNGVSFQMIDDMQISYEGKAHTCLEVHNSLYSRREQSSELCISAQGNFFDQCCDDISNRQPISDDTKFAASRSPTTSLPSSKPTEQFESWYTGALSSDSSILVSIGLNVLPVALGLLLCV